MSGDETVTSLLRNASAEQLKMVELKTWFVELYESMMPNESVRSSDIEAKARELRHLVG